MLVFLFLLQREVLLVKGFVLLFAADFSSHHLVACVANIVVKVIVSEFIGRGLRRGLRVRRFGAVQLALLASSRPRARTRTVFHFGSHFLKPNFQPQTSFQQLKSNPPQSQTKPKQKI